MGRITRLVILLCLVLSLPATPALAVNGGPDHPIYLPIVSKGSGGTSSPLGGQGVNVPIYPNGFEFPDMAIFWFGTVNPDTNYVDVRIASTNDSLVVYLAVIDRRIWYDETPTPTSLLDWDSASLYLDLDGNATKTVPDTRSYRIDSQYRPINQADEPYTRVYRGNGANWSAAGLSVDTTPGDRGIPNDDEDDKGWAMTYEVPYASLGLSTRPADGQTWRMAVVVHNRNDEFATLSNPLTLWPGSAQTTQPRSWGIVRFGIPGYTPAAVSSTGQTTVRNGLTGITAPSGEVGGGGSCGGDPALYWTEWGNTVTDVDNRGDFNVQNQSDISDWPCFSKAYLTFPLSQMPAGKVIVSATLTLYQMGNSDPATATPSIIQVLRVGQDWDEDTLTWNNAPQAIENVSQARVDVLPGFPGWPGVPRTWDLSRAVAEAYAAGQPLRLALYSADSDYHSGKYFVSADAGDWLDYARPTLSILWGTP